MLNTNTDSVPVAPTVRPGRDLTYILETVAENARRLQFGLPCRAWDPYQPLGATPRYERWEKWHEANPGKRMPPPPKRYPVLGHEVFDLYSALAFAMRKYAVVMNTHLTFAWAELGIENGDHAAEVLTRFNHEAGKWLGVGLKPDTLRKRRSPRCWLEPTEYMYVYVHEHSRQHGFHTHQLAFIPHLKAVEFERWAKSCLARMAGRPYVSKEMLCMRRPRPSLDEAVQVQRMWFWFRYIIKTLDPNMLVIGPGGGWMRVRALFRPWPFREGDEVDCARLVGGSRNIWTAAQKRAGYTARLFRDEQKRGGYTARLFWNGPGNIYDGLELDEHREEIAGAERDRTISKLVL